MIVFTLFSLLVVAYSLYDFKKAFIFYAAIKMFALGAMCLKYTPPALSMETFLNFYFLFAFACNGYLNKYKRIYERFPLKNYFVFQLISIVASALVTMIPVSSFLTGLIMGLVEDFIYPLLFFAMLRRDKSIIPMFIKYSMVLFLFAAILGIYEFFTSNNVFYNYLTANVPEELLAGKIYHSDERLGLARISSIFVSPNNMIYGAFISVLAYAYNCYSRKKIKHALSFTFLTITIILMANSRTVLFSSICIVAPIFFKIDRTFKNLLIGIVIAFFAYPFISKYSLNITSVISESQKTQIGGSSVKMRQEQLTASWKLFKQSPIVGNGYQSIKYFTSGKSGFWRGLLRGTESIWFKLLIERGLLGIIAYLYMFYLMAIKFNVLRNTIMLCYLGGYLIANTMSSLPGFNMSFLYITMIMLHYIINLKIYAHRNNNIT